MKKYIKIKYVINKEVRIKINKNIDARPSRTEKEKIEKQYLLYNYKDKTALRNVIAKSLGVGIDFYRTVMKFHYEKQYSVPYVASKNSHKVSTGDQYYLAT